jgi:hypothetical protein
MRMGLLMIVVIGGVGCGSAQTETAAPRAAPEAEPATPEEIAPSCPPWQSAVCNDSPCSGCPCGSWACVARACAVDADCGEGQQCACRRTDRNTAQHDPCVSGMSAEDCESARCGDLICGPAEDIP